MALTAGAQAPTSPWFGVWKLKLETSGQTPETLIYSDAGAGAMRMVSVEDKSEVITHFDGEPGTAVGMGSGQDWSLAIKATSATSYTWTFAKHGKPRAQGVNTLAPDLKTFKEVSWEAGKPETKMTITYERQ